MRSHILGLSLFTGLAVASMATFAEPPVQAGETLESLSKVKVTTTVNGQPASLNELIASGQIKPIQATDSSAAVPQTPDIDPNKAAVDPNAAADVTATEAPLQSAPAVNDATTQPSDGISEVPQLEPAANQ